VRRGASVAATPAGLQCGIIGAQEGIGGQFAAQPGGHGPFVPLALLGPLRDTGSWDMSGGVWSLAAGSLGAVGALGTILAFACGGKPFTVMPVVFGCAPVINTLTTLAFAHTPMAAVSPFFLAGMLIVAVGAAIVLFFGPRGHAAPK
jgi:hypothetical protein